MRRQTIALTAAVAMTAAFAPAVGSTDRAPEAVPDRGPVLAEPVDRGEVVLTEVAPRTPSTKTIDGDASDWIGEPTRLGGTSRFDAGEYVHSDFLFDAYGADDGRDRARLDQFAGLFYEETRTQRIDQVLRTSGSQLGVPEPLGAPDEYGDVDGGLDVADVREVRIGSDGEALQVLVSVANLTDPDRLGVAVLGGGLFEVSAGPAVFDPLGLSDHDFTTENFVSSVFAVNGRVETFSMLSNDIAATSATGHDGWENHVEIAADLDAFVDADGNVDVTVVAGRIEDDGSFTPLNVAFRGHEPVEIYNDRLQALALSAGDIGQFSTGPLAVADLVGGRTQDWTYGPGYFERQMRSGTNISVERGRDGIHQPYGLYVPTTWEPGATTPATYWLHYRGGKAHSGVVINPRLALQLGEERGNLMAFPHGRGTSEWYVTESHQDVLEVMGDFEGQFSIDGTRRYISGYSMGGYGSWLFSTLYPDMFAAAFVQSGAITQGAWVGTGGEGDPFDPLQDQGWVEANSGDARAQLTYRAVENLRHVPFAIDHGTNDELALNPQIERMAEKLTLLGYEHRFTRFLGYEHFTQAVMDEWADGAAYLDRFTLDPNPREVTYSVVPALVHAVNTVDPFNGAEFSFDPDGAYWIDDIEVREVGERTTVDDGEPGPALDAKGTVNATAHAIAAPGVVTLPDVGAVSPVDHSTPYVRTGLQLLEDPTGVTAPAVSNALTLDLANVAAVSVDTLRAGLTPDGATVTITSDGAATVRLVGALAGAADVTVDAVDAAVTVDGDDLLVVLDGSTTAIVTIG